MRSEKYQVSGENILAPDTPHVTPDTSSSIGLGLAEAGDAVAALPLAALLEKFDALKAFEDIALAAQQGRCAQTAML